MVAELPRAGFVITGGGRGLGRAMALGLLRVGAAVAVITQDQSDVDNLEHTVGGAELSGKLFARAADLRDAGACDRFVDDAARALGGLAGIVNNAGLTMTFVVPGRDYTVDPPAFWTISNEAVQAVFETNYIAARLMTSLVVPHLLAGGWGRIVNVTTSIGSMSRKGFCPYGPSKAALEAATDIWNQDLAGTGVTVNILNPGAGANTTGIPEQRRRAGSSGSARLLEPDEMIPPLLWLLSRDADNVTGVRVAANSWDALSSPAAAAGLPRVGFALKTKEA
jgi:NAD(P)-dependent dehydrogenase (short-subunit alcohol dehydrogenase family)